MSTKGRHVWVTFRRWSQPQTCFALGTAKGTIAWVYNTHTDIRNRYAHAHAPTVQTLIAQVGQTDDGEGSLINGGIATTPATKAQLVYKPVDTWV